MKRRIAVALLLFTCLGYPSGGWAFDPSSILKAYLEGHALRQQDDIRDQHIELQRLEAERIRQEIEARRLWLERQRGDEERKHAEQLREQYLSKAVLADITSIADSGYRLRAYELFAKIITERDQRIRLFAYEELARKVKERVGKQEALKHFEAHVKPRVVSVHPDFDDIMLNDKGYWEWAEQQRPALKLAAMDSPNPDDIIWALSEYKKHKKGQSTSPAPTRAF